MDIISHGLWAGAAYQAGNLRRGARRFNVWLAAAWGVFPDLFAFTVPFAWIFWQRLQGVSVQFPRPSATEPPTQLHLWPFNLAGQLYNFSHSLVIFAVVIALIWIVRRRVPLEMGGWFLHILMDIPTHSYRFFPTPFLWPISHFEINGFSWATSWFMVSNYSMLAIAYFVLWFWKRKS